MYFARRIGPARIMMVLTECGSPQAVHSSFRAELTRRPGHVSIRLSPLSSAGIATLLTEHLDAACVQRLAPGIAQVSGGNPLLARALLDDYRQSAGQTATLPVVEDNFAQAVRNCLYRFEETVLDVARAVAILEDHGSAYLAARLLGLPAGVADAAIATLNTAGVLQDGVYRHDSARAAVLDGLAPEDRVALHQGAARLLHDVGADAGTVAGHLITGGPVAAGWVVPVLQEAAEQALAEDRIADCVQLLQTACQAGGEDQARAIITSALARAEWRADPLAVRRHLPELTASVRSQLLAGADLRSAIEYLTWHGRPGEAAEALDQLAAGPGAEHGDAYASGQVLAHTYPAHPGFAAPDPHVTAPVIQVAGPGRPVKPEASGVACPLAWAEQILQETRLDDATLMPTVVALLSLIDADRLDKAASVSAALRAEAVARRSPLWQAVFEAVHALIAAWRGDPKAAGIHAEEALRLLPPRSWGVFLGLPLAALILSQTWLGRYEEAEALLRIPVPDAMFDTPYGLCYLRARGCFNLGTGRFHAAMSDFRTAGELTEGWGQEPLAFMPWRIGVAEAHLGLGHGTEAGDVIRDQLARLPEDDARARGMALRSLAAASELHKRPGLLREAVDMLERSGNRLELARAFADLSRSYQALGRYSQARMLGRRAERLAQQCGAEALKNALSPGGAPEPVTAIPQAADPSAKLSDSELRVAILAADGYTNRQISRRLCVTVSTVEQHLTHTYRKLGVNRLDDLASVFQAGTGHTLTSLNDRRPAATGLSSAARS
jgi:DNA-binding CsgD family transcriptional regulator